MNTLLVLKKTIKSAIAAAAAIMLILTPFVVSVTPGPNGRWAPAMRYQRAFALADVAILGDQQLNASYNPTSGILSLKISGSALANIGAINTEYFSYQLPQEFESILSNPDFKNYAKIDFKETWLLGSTSDTISGSSLTVNPDGGTVVGERTQSLNISLLPTITATLTIDLRALNNGKLPPSTDGQLEFYGTATIDALIDINLLTSEGSKAILATAVLPPPPTINNVTDQDTSVTGTGEAGDTVHITTQDGSGYQGTVHPDGTYSIAIPAQTVGTTIRAAQTNAAGIDSEPASTIVIGTLTFSVPNNIQFETTTLGLQEVTIHRADSNWNITVHNSRLQNATWELTARAEGPLTSTKDGLTLNSDALVYVSGSGAVQSLKEVVDIFDGTTGSGQDTTVQWRNEDEGVLIKLTPVNLETGVDYAATIDWTLSDAP